MYWIRSVYCFGLCVKQSVQKRQIRKLVLIFKKKHQ
jgi:hypothetical protein